MGEAVLVHLVGDWLLQSSWMANEKVKATLPALVHVTIYGLLFLLVTRSVPALAVIVGTHFVIDRWRLARQVRWVANFISPVRRHKRYRAADGRTLSFVNGNADPTTVGSIYHQWRSSNPSWKECSKFGSPPDTPEHIAFWVMIVADQTMHLLINYAALRWLT